jgi:uncharacterized protein YcfJ
MRDRIHEGLPDALRHVSAKYPHIALNAHSQCTRGTRSCLAQEFHMRTKTLSLSRQADTSAASFIGQPRLRHSAPLFAVALGLAAATLAGQAHAQSSPRVGDVLGAPSVVTTTVQARVLSSTPVVAQVAVPTQVCQDEVYQTPARSSGAGAVLGAIAGGAAGNAVGKGAGRALATGIGIIGGAIVGDHVETDGRTGQQQTVRRCEQQSAYENRVVAYSVTYEYAGQRYTTQTVSEPGPTLPLQVTLTPLVQAPVSTGTSYVNPGVVVVPDDGRRRRRNDW